MYDIGDKIVYPMYGAGVIQAIEEREVFDEKALYYVLSMPSAIRVMIPVANAEKINIRDVISAEEADRVLTEFANYGRDETENWNKRCRDNMTRIRGGDIYEIAFVVKSLMLRDRERMLSTGERKMLTNAKKILLSELTLAKDEPLEVLEKVLEGAI